ncbi:MAG: hypothetical protein ACXADY_03150 [Candidatus Hodarchaeales archaeon]|jgi:hypothetical protein
MPVSNRFGLNNNLEGLMQLIFIACNLFVGIEKLENGLLLLKTNEIQHYMQHERKQLLTYFLDLIHTLTYEKCHLMQDHSDPICYYFHGGS